MKTPFKVHIAVGQYEFVEVDAISPEHSKQMYDQVIKAFKTPTSPGTNSELNPKELLVLMHKYLVTNRMELEDVEKMGIDKNYSQKDIFNLIKSVFAKINRDNPEPKTTNISL